MPTHDFEHLPGNREERIQKLKQPAKDPGDAPMMEGKISDLLPEVEEGFWNHVDDIDEAPETTHFKQLEDSAVNLPAPEALDDGDLSLKLWEVIDKLATFRAFLHETNHLSDRELYTLLWTDILREETKDLTHLEGTNCQIPLLGSGSEEDTELYLKFYADDEYRRDWLEQFPDAQLPDHVDPAYDRDQYLPEADYGSPGDFENEEA
ncbi:MAG TPA: hypothetical protein VG028_15460 [Terriglobia bacterium]|nr:hypothetical protein [Terriglobia bacterium]